MEVTVLSIEDNEDDRYWSMEIYINYKKDVLSEIHIIEPFNISYDKWMSFINSDIDYIEFYKKGYMKVKDNNWSIVIGSIDDVISTINIPFEYIRNKIKGAIEEAKNRGYRFSNKN